ncbi:MAG: insulinase family protein, partial [Sphaerochaetaceae bacterium]
MTQRQWALGDEFAGFQLVEITQLDEYGGTGYLFRHIETNMEIFQLINSDRERFFSYVFRTLPSNDCGIAHILEHSVLAGSQRYPVRDPFMTLLKGSTNTFMNAMTNPDKTLYPGASPLKKDFENLFRVYTDAVFAPLLREETFWQEGVRLVCEDENCHYEGVVYNEMLGDSADHDSIVGKGSIRSLFPDTPYSFESGGNPEQIVRLDYKQFRSFYSQFYHPSNCKLFLYGDLEVGEYLSFLDEEY